MFRKGAQMFAWILTTLALTLLPTSPALAEDGASVYHRYLMKGSIVERVGGDLYLCIGSHDGAQVGQELDVVRVKRTAATGKSGIVRFERKKVGRVRIEEIVDEHFARAHTLSGEAMKGDLVELQAATP